MRVAIRLIGILAGLSVLATVVFLINFGSTGLRALMATGVFGVVTVVAWLVTFTAGPIAAVQLLRLRPSGRAAAAILFGNMLAYYAVGFLLFRDPNVPSAPILLLSVFLALIIVVILSPAAKRTCIAATVEHKLGSHNAA